MSLIEKLKRRFLPSSKHTTTGEEGLKTAPFYGSQDLSQGGKGAFKGIEVLSSHIDEGVMVLDEKGMISLINNSAMRLIGLGEKRDVEVIGRDILEVIRSLRLYELVKAPLLNPTKEPVSISIFSGTGNELKVTVMDVESIGRLLILRSKEDRLASNTANSLKALQDASHQLKTPLAAIKGYAETLIETPNIQDDARVEFLHAILKNCEKLEKITQSLLLLARLHREELRETFAPVDLKTVINDVITSLIFKIEEKRLNLIVEAHGKNIFVMGKKELLHTALFNILENAVEYSEAGSKILVYSDCNQSTGQFFLFIEDNGPGIASEDLSRIFERFYRAKNMQTKHPKGSGLGLSISKDIIEIHNGTIEIKSQWGKGTKVGVTLPVAD